MAFHQPTRQAVPIQRVIRPLDDDRDASPAHAHARVRPHLVDEGAPDESQTWVVFSPATEITTSASYLSEVDESVPTPGRSQISDVGSLNTAARSSQQTDSRQSAIDHESIEDDAELDSLDSHLPDFRTLADAYNQSVSVTGQHQSAPAHAHAPAPAPVLPTHDGLGSFRVDGRIGPDIQDHLYAFERFNPRRVRRRRESLDLAELQFQQEEDQQAHKLQRIETWRLEQSRLLLEEIHKETRRRRQSLSSAAQQSSPSGKHKKGTLNIGGSSAKPSDPTHVPDGMDWHEEPSPDDAQESQGFFARITRKVIRDIIGIDDRLLSIILGDAVPEDDEELSSTPKAAAAGPLNAMPPSSNSDESWQLQMLDRLAKELGDLMHRMAAPHPGAFTSYARVQQMPLPYAGLPVIPETAPDAATSVTSHRDNGASVRIPEFAPTMPQQAQPIDIIPGGRAQSQAAAVSGAQHDGVRANAQSAFTQEEWEKDIDAKLVFRYLRGRFASRSASSPSFTSGTSHLATCSTQDLAAKAARVRLHHPLVSRTRPATERRTFKATTPSSPVAVRHASSCASQSTRRSARRSSVSSRHYWDIGGSLGTGSMIASAGPTGSWGEV